LRSFWTIRKKFNLNTLWLPRKTIIWKSFWTKCRRSLCNNKKKSKKWFAYCLQLKAKGLISI